MKNTNLTKMVDYMQRHNLTHSTYNGTTMRLYTRKFDSQLMGGC